MSNAHSEFQSQDDCYITLAESKVDWSDLYKIKLILRQPSPNWKKFGIHNLKVYGNQ